MRERTRARPDTRPNAFIEPLESRRLLSGNTSAFIYPSNVDYINDPHTLTLVAQVAYDGLADYVWAGTVDFVNADTQKVLASSPVSGGRAGATLHDLPEGIYHISLVYHGEYIFDDATSGPDFFGVGKALTVTQLSSPGLAAVGAPIDLNIVVYGQMDFTDPRVIIFDGDVPVGETTLQTNPAKWSTGALDVGTHALRASFVGDSLHFASSSQIVQQVIKPTPVATTITLESSRSSLFSVESFKLTARVTAADGTAVHSGRILMPVGLFYPNLVIPIDGVAEEEDRFFLAPASYSLTASYVSEPDYDYAPSISAPVNITVSPSPTTLTLTADEPGIVYDPQRYSFIAATVDLPDGLKIVSGTVGLKDLSTGTDYGSFDIQQGLAHPYVQGLLPGTHVFEVRYLPDSDYFLSSSATVQITVDKISTTTELSVPSGSPRVVARIDPPLRTTGGKVVFTDGDAVLGEAQVAYDVAQLSLQKWSPGEHKIVAHFIGDDVSLPSDSTTYQFTNYGGVNVEFVPPAKRVNEKETQTLTARVTAKAGGVGPVSGTVEFFKEDPWGWVKFTDPVSGLVKNGRLIAEASVDENGVATATPDWLSTGHYSVVAVFFQIDMPFSRVPYADYPSLPQVPEQMTSGWETAASATEVFDIVTPVKLSFFHDGGTTSGNPPIITATFTNEKGGAPVWPQLTEVNSRQSSQSIAELHVPLSVRGLWAQEKSKSLHEKATVAPRFDYFYSPWLPLPQRPTGQVVFMEGSKVIGKAPINRYGTAEFFPKNMSPGTHRIKALYAGDSYFSAAEESIRLEIHRASSSTHLSANATALRQGEALTMQVVVNTPTGHYVMPGGKVALREAGKTLATLQLGKLQTLNLQLSPGEHRIRAFYLGDKNNLPSTSHVLAITVRERK